MFDTRGRYMQTWSGLHLHIIDPRDDEIDIRDIAHHLSLVNRYTGATLYPYSVAEHALNCCFFAEPEFKLEALLHDATEAYLADINSPLKSYLGDYKAIEGNLYRVIADKYGIPRETSNTVKTIDMRMLVTEAAHLMKPGVYEWWKEPQFPAPYEVDDYTFSAANGYDPTLIEEEFLYTFEELTS